MSGHNGETILAFNPLEGKPMPSRVSADQFRKAYGATAWWFDPWTGAKREDDAVNDDPLGLAIEAPEGAPRASDPPVTQADVIRLAGNTLTHFCHGASYDAGWWDDRSTGLDLRRVVNDPQTPMEELVAKLMVPTKLCLSHSELSEAMEGHRKGLLDDKLPHRPMLEVELADSVIRIADLAGALGLDLGGAIAEKMAYNAQRADHKVEAREAAGGKTF